MACSVVDGFGTPVCDVAGGLPRNLVFTIGRPVGAKDEGLEGGEGSDRVDERRGDELSIAAQSASEPLAPSWEYISFQVV